MRNEGEISIIVSKKVVTIFWTAFILGFTLSLMAMTDFFSESPFQASYTLMWMLQFGAFSAALTVNMIYLKKQRGLYTQE